MKKINNVVVFFGGKSVEREVSIITGCQVMRNINSVNNKVFPVYINENGKWLFDEKLKDITSFKNLSDLKLKNVCLLPNDENLYFIKGNKLKPLVKIDCVINCCHGTGGEDGVLAGVIESSGITCASPSVLSCSISMDKEASKIFFKGLGLNIVDYLSFDKNEFLQNEKGLLNKVKKFGFPVVVKPCSLGSSVGVAFCKNEVETKNALEVAFEFDEKVVVEKGLEQFDEFFCSAFDKSGKIMLSEIEKMSRNKVFDFEGKYILGGEREFPAKIDRKLKDSIKQMTKTVYEKFRCFGIIRIDFLFDKKSEKLFINEANVIPGSLAMGFWNNKFDFSEIIDLMIESAKEKKRKSENLVHNFSSNILKNIEGGAKGKLK